MRTHRQILNNIPRRVNKETRHTDVPFSFLLLIQLKEVTRCELFPSSSSTVFLPPFFKIERTHRKVRFPIRNRVGLHVRHKRRSKEVGDRTGVGKRVDERVENDGVWGEGGVEEVGGGDELCVFCVEALRRGEEGGRGRGEG